MPLEYTAASTESLLLPRECLTAWKTFKWLTLFNKAPELSCIFCTIQWYRQRPCNAFTTYRGGLVIKGQSIDKFFWLRDELKVFFTDHKFHLSDRLHDDEFLTWLAYLGDVFSCLNYLNLGLKGLSATIFNVRDKIEALIKKLELFAVCINKDNTHHCMIFYVQMNSNLRTMSNVI